MGWAQAVSSQACSGHTAGAMDAGQASASGSRAIARRETAHESQEKLLPAVSLHRHLLTQLNIVLTVKEKSTKGAIQLSESR